MYQDIIKKGITWTIYCRSKFLAAYQRIANRHHRTIGSVTTIPSYVPGSPRYMRKKYEEAITMANKLGPPDIFLTFTASADWPEIKVG